MNRDSLKQELIAWRDGSLSAVNGLLDRLFTHASEVLIEYAEKAESNRLQAVFLEGRSELLANQDRLRSLFSDALSREIFEFNQRSSEAPAVGAEVMSLVSKESHELSLALETICKQAVLRDQELYFALSQRLGVVAGAAAVRHELLPAGPYQLSRILERVTNYLKAERQVLLTIFALFDREVVERSAAWHEDLNERLRALGILPNIKYTFKNRDGTRRPARPEPAMPGRSAEPSQPAGTRVSSLEDNSVPFAGGERQASADVFANEHSPGGTACRASEPSAVQREGRDSDSDRMLPAYQGRVSEDDPMVTPPPGIENRGSRPSAASNQGDRSTGDQVLGRIRELLTARRARHAAANRLKPRPDPASPAPSTELVAVIDSPQMQAAAATPETGVLEAGVRRVKVSRFLLQRMRDVLQAQRDYIKKRIGEKRLSYLDEDTIDVVGMLFDAMLKDDRLGNAIKALLSHLHTPYLKLAVRDSAFLIDSAHPARLLLENMIESGSRWVDEGDLTFGVFPALQHVVSATRELKDYSPELFHEFGECLSAESKLFLERQQILEARTIETEKGQARLEEARRAAGQAAQLSLADISCPSDYQTFVNGPWMDYLTLLSLRCNGDTQNAVWQGALSLGQRLRNMVDEVTRGIPLGDAEVSAVRDELRERLGDVIPNYPGEAKRLFDIFAADQKIEIVAPTPSAPAQQAQAAPAMPSGENRLLEHLRELPPGSWLVFRRENRPDRVAKLSWLNKKTERFLFVDQTGSKAIVVSLNELASQIDRRQAHILPVSGESYVESTLSQVLKSLEGR